QNKEYYTKCLKELYPLNDSHRNSIENKNFVHLFMNDIIFYQRPLKSKKSQIRDCKFEKTSFIKDGKIVIKPFKCVSKSHPLFQEFRLWQFVHNLRIYKKDSDEDVTNKFLSNTEDWEKLFEWLNSKKEIDQKGFLKNPLFNLKKDAEKYRWNYVEEKTYPCNKTRYDILSRLEKAGINSSFLSTETEESLWHILYSVNDKIELEKALNTFATKHNLPSEFVEVFKKFPPFESEYAAFSLKAIKKLLPLMRMGKYWKLEDIHPQTVARIEKIINGEYDEKIKDRVRQKAILFTDITQFYNLPLWLASYIVYDRHSEDGELLKWNSPQEIEDYIKNVFKQHSLRNPIVEQVIAETLRVVADIWKYFGKSEQNFFNEIHIELGREMKNPADKRKQMTQTINEQENTNMRIKFMLSELLNDPDIANVRPYSPYQQEILKIYEDGVLNSVEIIPEDILAISKLPQPSQSQINKYKLWLDQKYRSPYTGEMIPLGKLFTPAYEIEHIIPQSRFFDDSFSNKVICEASVNSDKGNKLAFEYICSEGGKIIEVGDSKKVKILSKDDYETFVKKTFAKNKSKMKKLLMDEIPEAFIQRQLNDSRYISKVVKNLLSNILREEDEQETVSKHLLSTNGEITSVLKQDWGLNDIWNDIITPRFERLNALTNSNQFGSINPKTGKFLPQVPLELQKGFNKKRIDHRHHALDAIVIACATRDHINYLNNESALGKESKEEKNKKRFDLRNKLCYKKYNEDSDSNYKWAFHSPWNNFAKDAKDQIENIVVSFKQNLRVINKTVNYYEKLVRDEQGKTKKIKVKQTQGDNWAIRKSLHKDTVAGLVRLQRKKSVRLNEAFEDWQKIVDKDLRKKIKELIDLKYDKQSLQKYFKNYDNVWNGKDIKKVEIFYYDESNVASRVSIDESFTEEKIKEKITDSAIQKIMLNHLENYKGLKDEKGKDIAPETLAFSPEGIDEMNKNIKELNEGKPHHPIYKVRTYEPQGNKFAVGQKGSKSLKYVEAAKGTNLFFAIYQNGEGKRSYESIPLNIVVERLKQGLLPVPEINENEDKLLMYLSPNDLVGLKDENGTKNNLYKMVSSSGKQCFFVRHEVSSPIANSVEMKIFEYTSLNKMEKSIEGIMIKDHCIKLKVDRLGNIQPD
ncbi:MAG: type II CRISPR RNA-guided endonuclease Cas9, partial [Cytophagales bacterium]